MPRRPRQKSETGVYHVMVRGINKSDIFFDDQDRLHYLRTLLRAKKGNAINLYGYCLMTNHIHLVLKDHDNGRLPIFMKSLGISHASFINWKYDRVGHLYQNRYRSEIISTEGDLLACLRYVHNNPPKAGLSSTPGEYRWSSYSDYLRQNENELVSTEYILNLFAEDRQGAQKEFIKFSQEQGNEDFLDISDHDSDDDHLAAVLKILTQNNLFPNQLKEMGNVPMRSRVIKQIRESTQVTVDELVKILGLSKSTILRSK